MSLVLRVAIAIAALAACDAASAQYCTVDAFTIAFGTVNGIGQGDKATSGTVTVRCSGSSTSWVRACIAIGAPVDNSFDPRYMDGPRTPDLAYNIYSDSGYSQIWGSAFGTAGTQVPVDVYTPGGTGTATKTYYAKVPAQNSVAPGSYSRTFTPDPDTAVRNVGFNVGPGPACQGSWGIASRFNLSVNATVVTDCGVSAGTLNFGSVGIGLATAAVNATSTISVTCSNTVPYTVAIGAGQGSGATVAQRKLTRSAGGTQTLLYRLYRDSGRTLLWGDGTSGTSTLAGTGAGIQSPSVLTVYGTLSAQAVPPAGTYNDQVIVTVTY